jgi:hypothetical protein
MNRARRRRREEGHRGMKVKGSRHATSRAGLLRILTQQPRQLRQSSCCFQAKEAANQMSPVPCSQWHPPGLSLSLHHSNSMVKKRRRKVN